MHKFLVIKLKERVLLEDRDNIKIDLTNKKVRGHGLE
jgi:hypothetical protein